MVTLDKVNCKKCLQYGLLMKKMYDLDRILGGIKIFPLEKIIASFAARLGSMDIVSAFSWKTVGLILDEYGNWIFERAFNQEGLYDKCFNIDLIEILDNYRSCLNGQIIASIMMKDEGLNPLHGLAAWDVRCEKFDEGSETDMLCFILDIVGVLMDFNERYCLGEIQNSCYEDHKFLGQFAESLGQMLQCGHVEKIEHMPFTVSIPIFPPYPADVKTID